MSGRAVLLLSGLLLLLMAAEFGLAFTPVSRLVLPAIALCMVVTVALGFMRLGTAGTLAAVFAVAGVFWLCIMMSLGSLDPATRTTIQVTRTDVRFPQGGMPPR